MEQAEFEGQMEFEDAARDEWDVKQVIVIRRDLHMRRGKEIAQGAHAAMYFMYEYMNGRHSLSDKEREWLVGGRFTKAVVTVRSEEELLALRDDAEELGVTAYVVMDSGRTEFGGVSTYTALAVGPDTRERVDKITGHLKLY